jgi:hypothetical protein
MAQQMSDMLQLVVVIPKLLVAMQVGSSAPQRQAEEPLAKFNFSFSPGFILGSQRALNFSNRFNGFRRCAEIFSISM